MSGEDRGAEGRRVAASPFVRGDKRDMMKRKRPERLTPHEELFVKEYLVDLNATQAWIRAGGDPTFASRVGPAKLKAGTLVSIAVGRALAERSKRVGITADRVLMEIARVALGDPRVLFRPDGSLRAPTEYNEDDAAMIEGIKTRRIVEVAVDETGKQALVPVEIQEVKLASKIGALTQLGRHLGLFNDKLELTVNAPLAQALDAAFQRTGRQPLTIKGEAEDVTDEGDGEDYSEDAEHEGDDEPQSDDLSLNEMLGLE